MNAKTIKAINQSIEKWKRNLLLAELKTKETINLIETSADDCDLCKLFHINFCEECPVYKKTQRRFCSETPHQDVVKILTRILDENHQTEEQYNKLIKAIKKEIAFLESLLEQQ